MKGKDCGREGRDDLAVLKTAIKFSLLEVLYIENEALNNAPP